MHAKVIEGRSSNYRVDDCDWLIAGMSNAWRMRADVRWGLGH